MAERVGFEPTIRLNTGYAISNRAPSTTRTPLRANQATLYPFLENSVLTLTGIDHQKRRLTCFQTHLPRMNFRNPLSFGGCALTHQFLFGLCVREQQLALPEFVVPNLLVGMDQLRLDCSFCRESFLWRRLRLPQRLQHK